MIGILLLNTCQKGIFGFDTRLISFVWAIRGPLARGSVCPQLPIPAYVCDSPGYVSESRMVINASRYGLSVSVLLLQGMWPSQSVATFLTISAAFW